MTLVESALNPPVSYTGDARMQLGNLVIGSVDTAGVRWTCKDLPGWGEAGSTGRLTQRTYAHGGWANRAFLTPGAFGVRGLLRASSYALAVAAWDRLLGVLSTDDLQTVIVTEGTTVRQCDARIDGPPLHKFLSGSIIEFDLLFQAPDPRRLSATLRTASTGLASSSGGLSWPVSWPITFGATVTGGSVTVVNDGNVTAPCTVRFTGPVPTPRLYHVGQGRELTLSFEVLSGQYVDVNLDTRSVLLNGTVSRKGLVSGRWPTIEPGSNVLRFAAASYEASALMTASWRDAYR